MQAAVELPYGMARARCGIQRMCLGHWSVGQDRGGSAGTANDLKGVVPEPAMAFQLATGDPLMCICHTARRAFRAAAYCMGHHSCCWTCHSTSMDVLRS